MLTFIDTNFINIGLSGKELISIFRHQLLPDSFTNCRLRSLELFGAVFVRYLQYYNKMIIRYPGYIAELIAGIMLTERGAMSTVVLLIVVQTCEWIIEKNLSRFQSWSFSRCPALVFYLHHISALALYSSTISDLGFVVCFSL